jgi:DNA ligase-1
MPHIPRTSPLDPSRRALCRAALAAPLAAWGLPALARTDRSALAPLLAREWSPDADPAGFLVSEKFDGVRALWDGRQLRFRSGGLIAAPGWFTAGLPRQPLDGELWLGRGQFEALAGTVRHQQPDDADWRAVRYQVFELPAAGGTFAERAQALAALCQQTRFAPLVAVAQSPVADRAALQKRLDAVLALGGEGLVLHRADAPQASGRGPWLFKHKPLHDAEAVVLAHLPGHGRLAGQLGALQVRADDGAVFSIGTGLSDADRAHPPAVDQRISFTHRGFTAGGVPRFASYLRAAPVF